MWSNSTYPNMITILAEKFDIAIRIVAALSGFDFHGKKVNINNYDKVKAAVEKEFKPNRYLMMNWNGKEYAVTWAQWHLLGLKQAKDYNPEYAKWSKIPFPYFPDYEIKVNEKIDRETGKSTGEPDPWTLKQLEVIKELFKRSDSIIGATDDDREGSLIFSYIYEYTGSTLPYKRVKIDSMTEEGFRHAFTHLLDSSETVGSEHAGRCRAILDWMTGANISAEATLKYKKYVPELSMLTVGRVQTYAFNLIVERELFIRNFKPSPFWTIVANFETDKGEVYTGKHEAGRFTEKEKAEIIFNKVNGLKGVVESFEKIPASREVPLLYSLSSLSIAANEKLKISSSDTLKICQSLYEKGYTTYPRTDSQCLTSDMQPTVDEVLTMLSSNFPQYKTWIDPVKNRNYTKRHFDTKKVDSHFAIIPTNVQPVNMTEKEAAVYDLIAKSLIRIIYKPAVLEKTSVVTNVNGEKFLSSGTVVVDPQWLIVDAMPTGSDTLPVLTICESVDGSYELKEGKTEPPKRYTEATLIAALKTASKTIDDEALKKMLESSNKGAIGRPSSMASIIHGVVSRYCSLKGQQIVPSEAGIKMMNILPIEDLKSPEMTAQWETKLDEVQKGKLKPEELISQMEKTVAKWCKEIEDDTREFEIPVQADTSTMDIMCPKCKKPLRKLSWGLACSGYNNDGSGCKFALGYNIAGATLTDKDLETLVTKKRTRYISNFKKKDGTEYGAFLILDDEGNLGRTWDTGFMCPKCGKPVSVGKKGWGCSGWKEGCDFVLWDTVYGKKLTTSEKEQILKNGRTKSPVKNLLKKNGDKFDSVIGLDENKKVVLLRV